MTRRMGRPSVPICTHDMPGTHHGRCVKNGHVRIVTEMAGRQLMLYRCWKHYVDLENKARNSSTLNIIRSSIIE